MSARSTIAIAHLATGPTPPTTASLTWPNVLHTRLADVVAAMGPAPWAKRLIADERQLVTLIAAPPGDGNRPHWHADFDEWWVVFGGHLEWELTGGGVVRPCGCCRRSMAGCARGHSRRLRCPHRQPGQIRRRRETGRRWSGHPDRGTPA